MNNFNINKKSTQSGRSMIEMLGVLAIVGVLSVGGIAGYSKAMEKFKINKHIDYITHIATNIQTLCMQQSDYSGVYDSNLKDLGVLPDGVTYENYALQFGDGVYAYTGLTSWRHNNFYSIALFDLSKTECIELATKDWGSTTSGLHSIGIDGNGGYLSPGYSPLDDDIEESPESSSVYQTKKVPVTVAKASQYCTCATNNCAFRIVLKK